MLVILLIIAAAGQTTFLPDPWTEAAAIMWTTPANILYFHASMASCEQGEEPTHLFIHVPQCEAADADEDDLSTTFSCSTTEGTSTAVYNSFAVAEGKCAAEPTSTPYVAPFGKCEPDFPGTGATINFCSDGKDVPLAYKNPWVSPESVHLIHLQFKTADDCTGVPAGMMATLTHCSDTEGGSTLMRANGEYTLYKEKGCTGDSQAAGSMPASEGGCVKSVDGPGSAYTLFGWSCPVGCEHDTDNDPARRLLFGSFKKISMCPAHCKAT
jgi:hypothetical protein